MWKWMLAGFVVGMALLWSYQPSEAQVRPNYLIYGRTSRGVNVPFLVDSSGVLQTE